jgi:hypothetical protein
MSTVMIIGDVGGCSAHLAAAVEPVLDDADTVVIQVGDLIDRGPDSPGVLALVGRRLDLAPDRWIQLVGNHESQYLGSDRSGPAACPTTTPPVCAPGGGGTGSGWPPRCAPPRARNSW